MQGVCPVLLGHSCLRVLQILRPSRGLFQASIPMTPSNTCIDFLTFLECSQSKYFLNISEVESGPPDSIT